MKNYERVPACDVVNIEDISEGNFGDIEYNNQNIPIKVNYKNKVELAITSSHLKTIRKGYLENLENIIVCLLDEIVSMSINYNIDIHDGDSNYNYYKNEFNKYKM